jgi:hypothetical protein
MNLTYSEIRTILRQTEWTNLIVVRGLVLISGHRRHLVAGRENIPYATLATPNTFVQQLETRTIQCETGTRAQWLPRRSLSANIRKGIMNCHQANVRAESALPSTADMARVIRPPGRRGRDIQKL